MASFSDLTAYSYEWRAPLGKALKNVGWLGPGIEFGTKMPEPDFLERLWQHCLVSVNQTRGLYECHLCRNRESNVSERDGRRLLLGSAEIRVLSRAGDAFAAPNLIYHYVSVHRYSPPKVFEDAVKGGLAPCSEEYFDRLTELGITCGPTLTSGPNQPRLRFVKTPDGVKRIEE